MQKSLGAERAKKLQLRLDDLRAAEKMADLLQMTGKWEELKADRAGQWSARLTGNWRLIVEADIGHSPKRLLSPQRFTDVFAVAETADC